MLSLEMLIDCLAKVWLGKFHYLEGKFDYPPQGLFCEQNRVIEICTHTVESSYNLTCSESRNATEVEDNSPLNITYSHFITAYPSYHVYLVRQENLTIVDVWETNSLHSCAIY